MHEHEPRDGLDLHTRQDLAKAHTRPVIVEPAPPGDAVKVAMRGHLWQSVKLAPTPAQRRFDQTIDLEVPAFGVKPRYRAVMQHGPLQRERLPGWQSPFALHLLLKRLPLVPFKKQCSLAEM